MKLHKSITINITGADERHQRTLQKVLDQLEITAWWNLGAKIEKTEADGKLTLNIEIPAPPAK